MEKFLKYSAIVLVLALPVMSLAFDYRVGEQPGLSKSERVTHDLYMAGSSVSSAGDVAGDLTALGGNIVISGDVGADLMALGGNINILSNIGDDVRVVGGTVVLSGLVGGDLLVGGGQVTIGGSGVEGDAVVGGGDVRIDSRIVGELFVAGGNIYINSAVGGDVKIEGEHITLGSKAVISGNLTYSSSEELVKEDGAVVKGKITFQSTRNEDGAKGLMALLSAFLLLKFFTLLACAFLFGLTLRRYGREMVAQAVARPLFELGRGLLVLVAMPVISILFFVTMVGAPLGILGLIGFAALLIFSWIMAPIIVGSVVYKYFAKGELEVSWKTILLGVVLYSLLGVIPVIGGCVQFILMLLTLGCLVALKLRIVKEWR